MRLRLPGRDAKVRLAIWRESIIRKAATGTFAAKLARPYHRWLTSRGQSNIVLEPTRDDGACARCPRMTHVACQEPCARDGQLILIALRFETLMPL